MIQQLSAGEACTCHTSWCCWRCCYRDARPFALFTSPSCNARSDFPGHVLCQSRSISVRTFKKLHSINLEILKLNVKWKKTPIVARCIAVAADSCVASMSISLIFQPKTCFFNRLLDFKVCFEIIVVLLSLSGEAFLLVDQQNHRREILRHITVDYDKETNVAYCTLYRWRATPWNQTKINRKNIMSEVNVVWRLRSHVRLSISDAGLTWLRCRRIQRQMLCDEAGHSCGH